jgi:hypothetical protein
MQTLWRRKNKKRHMTNNNWEEEFWAKVKFYNLSLDNENYSDLMEFTKYFLTKKDQEIAEIYDKAHAVGFRDCALKLQQEHKAELEMIKGEIENLEVHLVEPLIVEAHYGDYVRALEKKEVIAILDSHINKLLK